MEWTGALVVALLLHTAVVIEMPSTRVAIADRRAGTPEGSTRVRLSLGAPRSLAPAAAEPAPAPVAKPPPPKPAPRAARKPPPAPIEAVERREAPKPIEKPAVTPVEKEPPVTPGPATAPEPASEAAGPGPVSAASAAPNTGVEGSAAPARGESDGAEQARGIARGDYFGGIVQRVSEELDYPRRARLQRVEGTVVLAIRIDRQGELERCELAESSGSRLLDRHALRSARRAAPFGAVPPTLGDDDLEFELPLDFVLED